MPRRRSQYCLGCGYEIAQLRDGVCPECGRAFDPDDMGMYAPWLSQVPGRGHEPMWGAIVGAVLLAIVLTMRWGAMGLACGVLSGAFVGFFIGYACRKDRP